MTIIKGLTLGFALFFTVLFIIAAGLLIASLVAAYKKKVKYSKTIGMEVALLLFSCLFWGLFFVM